MNTKNQEVKDRNVVWENRKNHTRFMTQYTEGKSYEDDEHHLVIGTNLSYDDALVLCNVKVLTNITTFLEDMPAELRDRKTDALIANIIKYGK